MSDLISRQDAIAYLMTNMAWYNEDGYEESEDEKLNAITDLINGVPSAEPERKKGKWIDKSGGIEGAWNYCSVCMEQAIDLYDFCPNCGSYNGGKNEV